MVGKDGVTEATAESIRTALAARELVKCKVLDNCPYKAKEAAEMFCEYIGCESVQVIGGTNVQFAHDPVTDRIIVIDDGIIIGQGKHEDLLENCAEYREISESQMGGAFVE